MEFLGRTIRGFFGGEPSRDRFIGGGSVGFVGAAEEGEVPVVWVEEDLADVAAGGGDGAEGGNKEDSEADS